jgi:uncharacterized protein
MTAALSESWDRYALLVDLATRLHAKGYLGKKALQKLVYLLQELENVPAGYRFRFFTYGPFSDDLAFALDVVEGIGGLKITYDQNMNTYEIMPGRAASNVLEKGRGFLEKHRPAIDHLIDHFGGRTAMELELIATIVYLLDAKGEMNDDNLVTAVLELKPKYERGRVKRVIEDLAARGYIN